MMKILYPFKKYIDSIDKTRTLKIENIFKVQNRNQLEEVYEFTGDILKCSNTNKKIYKLTNILDKEGKTYLPFKELELDSGFIKRYKENNNTITFQEWSLYVDKVIEAISKNKDNFIKIYSICMKYLSNVPAVNNDKCNISLFDLCKINSAINNCISRNNEKFILIKGDFSGIQKFIYKTKDDGALKVLKGRSLYLTILQDLCSKYIVRELELDISNILYSGGGNFYILASFDDIKKFNIIKKNLSNIILDSHNGDIYLALAYSEFTKDDFGDFSEVWKAVGNEIGIIKNRKWTEVGLEEKFEDVFGPIDDGGTLEKSCTVCGSLKKVSEGSCSLCKSYKELVEKARNKKFYIEEDICENRERIDLSQKWEVNSVNDIFARLGFRIYFEDNITNDCDNKVIYSINNFSNEKVDSFTFKSIKFNSKSLDEISKSNESKGDKRIAVLKLDVDNLGQLFIQTSDINQVMGLSRAMSLFFEAFVENLIFSNKELNVENKNLKTIDNWKDKITVIYAGGDDTFIVGRYDEVFEFSQLLRDTFRKYVGNDGITFSAGVGMFNANFLILRTAEIAEEFLEGGKQTKEKNKISFMGEVFSWEQFSTLIELKNSIEEVYNMTNNKALFEKINNSTKGFKAIFKNGNSKINYVKVYKLAYYLRDLRNMDNPNVKDLVDNLIDKYEDLCLNSIKEGNSQKNAMIIPYANKWAQCNCRNFSEES